MLYLFSILKWQKMCIKQILFNSNTLFKFEIWNSQNRSCVFHCIFKALTLVVKNSAGFLSTFCQVLMPPVSQMHMGDTFVFKQILFPRIADCFFFFPHEKSLHGNCLMILPPNCCVSHSNKCPGWRVRCLLQFYGSFSSWFINVSPLKSTTAHQNFWCTNNTTFVHEH